MKSSKSLAWLLCRVGRRAGPGREWRTVKGRQEGGVGDSVEAAKGEARAEEKRGEEFEARVARGEGGTDDVGMEQSTEAEKGAQAKAQADARTQAEADKLQRAGKEQAEAQTRVEAESLQKGAGHRH